MKKIMVLMLIGCLAMGGCGKVEPSAGTSMESSAEQREIQESSGEAEEHTEESNASDNESESSEEGSEENGDDQQEPKKTAHEFSNNGGYFVELDHKVYFRCAAYEGMDETALFGEFANGENDKTVLCCYDMETGETERIMEEYGYGKIAVSNGLLVLQKWNADREFSYVEIYDPENMERMKSYEGSLAAVDENNQYAAIMENMPDVTRLTVLFGQDPIAEKMMDGYLSVVGMVDQKIVYLLNNYETDETTLYVWDGETDIVTCLGVLPQHKYGYETVEQFEAVGNQIYLGYGFYEGTGHFYCGGCYITAELGSENSVAVLEELESVEEEFELPAFVVKDGLMKSTDGIPGTAYTDPGSGKVGYYDEEGKWIVVTDGYPYYENEADETLTDVDETDFVDGKVFLIQNVMWRAPEKDIGWRYAYRRACVNIYMIDAVTKETKEIMYVQNPSLVEGDIDWTGFEE